MLEAFAAGVPVIASNLGGLSEIVEENVNGTVFAANDAKALQTSIERIANDTTWFADLNVKPLAGIAACFDAFDKAYRATS
jgi:glycosyltransferase involved in cell wall biosynthesis